MTNKELFQKFSEEHAKVLPFSLQFNWWNEVIEVNWEVAIAANQDQVFAVMPYFIRKKGPFTLLTNPHFTPYCGAYIIYPFNQKKSTKIAFELKTHEILINQLPIFSEYTQNFHLNFNNSLAFLWNNFQDSNRYTYRLDLKPEKKELYSNLRENNRRQIKKAKKSLKIENVTKPHLLKNLLNESYPNDIELNNFERILQYIKKYECGKMWVAQNETSESLAALVCIWDSTSSYYLIGGTSNEAKNSGAMSLLLWNAILESKKNGLQYFNFEGSSIPTIEKYLRGFGGDLITFRRITKNASKTLEFAKMLKG